jgi:hypothetical protein
MRGHSIIHLRDDCPISKFVVPTGRDTLNLTSVPRKNKHITGQLSLIIKKIKLYWVPSTFVTSTKFIWKTVTSIIYINFYTHCRGPFSGYELANMLTRSLYLPEKEKEHKLASKHHMRDTRES